MRAALKFTLKVWNWYFLAGGALLFLSAFIWYGLRPVSSYNKPIILEIGRGEGFFEIMNIASEKGLFRAPFIAKLYGLMSGEALRIRAGTYALYENESVPHIFGVLTSKEAQEVEVRIPEGATLYAIDALLSEEGIIRKGELITLGETSSIEGKLFPDTYRFLLGSSVAAVAEKMQKNFEEKTSDILKGKKDINHILILASLLEKEVPEYRDREVVAGILEKRLNAGMPLQLDATVCFVKLQKGESPCYPLHPLDFTIDSPYNTYVYRGLPPGPIGNPGREALMAALHPISSPYWFYLSDPVTKKTVFAETLDSHSDNRIKYLKVTP